jgi:putative endonuclease
MKPDWFVYLVRCRGNSLYCGITNNLVKRIREHNSGTGAKYTASRRPVVLVYSEQYPDATAARKREAQMKTLAKEQKEQLVKTVSRPLNLDELNARDPKIKYACAKNVLAIGKTNPASLYADLPVFTALLDSPFRILKWTAIETVGHLSRVDRAKNTDKLLDKLYGLLNEGNMITANHAIAALAEIAAAKPEHAGAIVEKLLEVEGFTYATPECRNIALGKVIIALRSIPASDGKIIAFVQRQTKNPRNATRKKAEEFLKRTRS